MIAPREAAVASRASRDFSDDSNTVSAQIGMIDYARRSDLDAVRAGAMLLGIVLHASLSSFRSYWMVTDRRQNDSFGILSTGVLPIPHVFAYYAIFFN